MATCAGWRTGGSGGATTTWRRSITRGGSSTTAHVSRTIGFSRSTFFAVVTVCFAVGSAGFSSILPCLAALAQFLDQRAVGRLMRAMRRALARRGPRSNIALAAIDASDVRVIRASGRPLDHVGVGRDLDGIGLLRTVKQRLAPKSAPARLPAAAKSSKRRMKCAGLIRFQCDGWTFKVSGFCGGASGGCSGMRSGARASGRLFGARAFRTTAPPVDHDTVESRRRPYRAAFGRCRFSSGRRRGRFPVRREIMMVAPRREPTSAHQDAGPIVVDQQLPRRGPPRRIAADTDAGSATQDRRHARR